MFLLASFKLCDLFPKLSHLIVKNLNNGPTVVNYKKERLEF